MTMKRSGRILIGVTGLTDCDFDYGILRSASIAWVHMSTVRWLAMLSLTAVFAVGLTVESHGQSGGGSGGAGGGGGTGGAGGSMASPGGAGSARPGMSRGKNFDGTLK